MSLTRRQFISSAGAAAAAPGVVLSASARRYTSRKKADVHPNIVVIVVDTLRSDHVYGDSAKTPNMDVLLREGLRFTSAYPEAMPTVPGRNSLLSGRRMFP